MKAGGKAAREGAQFIHVRALHTCARRTALSSAIKQPAQTSPATDKPHKLSRHMILTMLPGSGGSPNRTCWHACPGLGWQSETGLALDSDILSADVPKAHASLNTTLFLTSLKTLQAWTSSRCTAQAGPAPSPAASRGPASRTLTAWILRRRTRCGRAKGEFCAGAHCVRLH